MGKSCMATVEPAYFPLFFKVAEETCVIKVDINYAGLTEDTEEIPGAILPLDNTLHQVSFSMTPVPSTGTVTLTIPSHIHLWKDPQRQIAVAGPWNLAVTVERDELLALLANGAWIEMVQAGTGFLTLTYGSISDRVAITAENFCVVAVAAGPSAPLFGETCTLVTVSIKDEDGGEPPAFMGVNSSHNFKIVTTPDWPLVFVSWSTSSGKISLSNTLSQTVTVTAGSVPSDALPGETFSAAVTVLGVNPGAPPVTVQRAVGVLKVDLITPDGDPVASPDDSGDGQNEFTYSTASSGVLTMHLRAKVIPSGIAATIKDQCHFAVGTIGSSTLAWDAINPGGKPTASGDFLEATVTFTGLPANNTDFGTKMAAVYFDGTKCDEEDYEVFYNATAANHPGGTATDPNWFYYYKLNAGGGAYTYKSIGRSDSASGGGLGTVRIANEAYAGDTYITTTVTAGQLEATGWSSTTRYYANFLGVLAHESQHAVNETPGVNDPDGDFLSNTFETGTSQTDPNDKYSALGVLVGSAWDDGEVYAGGPVEAGGIAGANTSQDWADPGTNSVP